MVALTLGALLAAAPVGLARVPADLGDEGSSSTSAPEPPPMVRERGRPRILDGTVVTDIGSRIRGASYIAYYNCANNDPASWSLASLAEWGPAYGLNAVRVFVPPRTQHCAGGADAAPLIDRLVRETAKDGLYIILVPGGDGDGSTLAPELQAFWEFYAPRYKDHTHVIYEIKNEPEYAPGYPPDVIRMEIDLWNTIRSLAPDSMILAWSPGAFIGHDSSILRDLSRGVGVDYSNTAVAVHDYCYRDVSSGCVDDMGGTVSTVRRAGYPLIVTEFYSCHSAASMGSYISHFEELGVAWTVFRFPGNGDPNDDCAINSAFQNDVNSGRITWTPDYRKVP